MSKWKSVVHQEAFKGILRQGIGADVPSRRPARVDHVMELLDNSIDACAPGSEDILCQWDSKVFSIADNGIGFSLDALRAFGDLGCSVPSREGARSGYYGMGGRQALLGIAGTDDCNITLDSVHGEIRRVLKINFKSLPDNDYMYDAPAEYPCAGCASGTTISVELASKRAPGGKAAEKLVDDLSKALAPALRRGARVRFILSGREFTLSPPQWPAHQSEHVGHVVVDGKRADYHVVVPIAGEPFDPGISLEYGHRSLIDDMNFGAYSTAGVVGRVTLNDEDWKPFRSTNKNGIDGYDDLIDALLEQLAPVLVDSAERELTVKLDRSLAELEDILNTALFGNNAKAKRNPPREHKPRKPKERDGSPHTDAEKKQRGTRFPGGPPPLSHSLRLKRVERPDDERPGWLQGGNTILLNVAHRATEAMLCRWQKGDPALMLSFVLYVQETAPGTREIPPEDYSSSDWALVKFGRRIVAATLEGRGIQ